MLRQYIRQAAEGVDFSADEMARATELVLNGEAKPSQIAALLLALRLKGETADEIAGAAGVVRRIAPSIRATEDVVVLDRDEINLDEETVLTCSLDGADTRTFNISTATALVAAGGGLKVAKYGARAESTFCGSANVVSTMGINLDLTLTEVERCLEQVGLGFLYANLFLTPLAQVTRVREEIGIRTIFNLIGPLTNPAGGNAQVLGVYLPERVELMARALQKLGCRQALVVRGEDTYDEISITGPTQMARVSNGDIKLLEIVPEDVGLARATPEDISGGGAEVNAGIIRDILEGAGGPRRDVVLVNAAAAFLVAGKADTLADGVQLARDAIDSGRAKAVLDELIDFTGRCRVYQHKDVS